MGGGPDCLRQARMRDDDKNTDALWPTEIEESVQNVHRRNECRLTEHAGRKQKTLGLCEDLEGRSESQ